jgi:hypothetical protein
LAEEALRVRIHSQTFLITSFATTYARWVQINTSQATLFIRIYLLFFPEVIYNFICNFCVSNHTSWHRGIYCKKKKRNRKETENYKKNQKEKIKLKKKPRNKKNGKQD